MKHLPLLSLACIIFVSCKKNGSPAIQSVAGKWELRQTMSDMGVKTYDPGNGITLQISGSTYLLSDTAYAYFVSMAPAKQGSCATVPDASASETVGLVLDNGYNNRMIFNGDNTRQKAFFKLNKDTLTIVSGFFPTDGGIQLKLIR